MPYIKNVEELASNPNRKIVVDLIETAYASIAPDQVFKTDFSFTENDVQEEVLIFFDQIWIISLIIV
jgi:hypothetical protein